MLNVPEILVSTAARRLVLAAVVVGTLAGCGQRGPLFLPTEPAAAQRATLPQTLSPARAASAPPSGTATPAPRQ
ncbi:lipoprotein [Ramlibacter sp. RBP-2]|uniref:Lipoprotein n=1 Tax=Ramlibacter lithotrophicus TaxID=2606681 RepID=A0A7X6I6V0_9BURK|nr:lipoprotein [Ramlibacter lithotrophicus]NKE66489.1 lipoprotein [Ramlibacter lithotrophicus]